jgi:hypothetical protein
LERWLAGEINMPSYLQQSSRLILNADARLLSKRAKRTKESQKRRRKAPPAVEIISRPPDYGAQVSDSYLMHAHFEFLRRRLAGSRSFRFYLDPDSGFQQALLAMFHREIAADRVEAFVVQIDKNMTRPQREKAIGEAWGVFEGYLAEINERLALGDTLEQLRTTGINQIIAEWEADLVHPSPSPRYPPDALQVREDWPGRQDARIKSRSGELDVSMMFACIIILSVFGIAGVALVEAVERRVVFWRRLSAQSRPVSG